MYLYRLNCTRRWLKFRSKKFLVWYPDIRPKNFGIFFYKLRSLKLCQTWFYTNSCHSLHWLRPLGGKSTGKCKSYSHFKLSGNISNNALSDITSERNSSPRDLFSFRKYVKVLPLHQQSSWQSKLYGEKNPLENWRLTRIWHKKVSQKSRNIRWTTTPIKQSMHHFYK